MSATGLAGLAVLDDRVALLVSVAVFGLSVGNVLLLQPVVLSEVFGVRDFSRLYARSQLIGTAGIAAGPILVGVLRDVANGYGPAYL
ncbi:MAG: hypothetical protein KY450_14135, partial [Actinobacteria bacterium]|nr:hypothetical protein [Actinomycetota bacterium]